MPARIAVFASGAGSNLEALCRYLDRRGPERGGEVALVLSARRGAGALAHAAERGIATVVIDDPNGTDAIAGPLAEHGAELLVLAGYARLIPGPLTEQFRGRMVNIHPALLPAFGGLGMYGVRVHAAVLASGARVTGATVHFVDESYDNGPIIAQWPVPIYSGDTPAMLSDRVLRVEHLLYPRVIDAVASGRIRLEDGRIRRVGGFLPGAEAFALSNIEMEALATQIDAALTQ